MSPLSIFFASSTSCAAVEQRVLAGLAEEELQRVGRRLDRRGRRPAAVGERLLLGLLDERARSLAGRAPWCTASSSSGSSSSGSSSSLSSDLAQLPARFGRLEQRRELLVARMDRSRSRRSTLLPLIRSAFPWRSLPRSDATQTRLASGNQVILKRRNRRRSSATAAAAPATAALDDVRRHAGPAAPQHACTAGATSTARFRSGRARPVVRSNIPRL